MLTETHHQAYRVVSIFLLRLRTRDRVGFKDYVLLPSSIILKGLQHLTGFMSSYVDYGLQGKPTPRNLEGSYSPLLTIMAISGVLEVKLEDGREYR